MQMGQNIWTEQEQNLVTCHPCRHNQLDKLTAAVTRGTSLHKKVKRNWEEMLSDQWHNYYLREVDDYELMSLYKNL